MPDTRSDLEQQALRLVTRGQFLKAVELYQRILARDPHDRRIRQKMGELYLKAGREAEGLKCLREAAAATLKDGQARAAIALFKILQGHLPDDLAIAASLADGYRQAGMAAEAERAAEDTLQAAAARRDWATALAMAAHLVELRPTDLKVRFQRAELLQAAGDASGALAAWRDLAPLLVRRGDLGEVARVLEAAVVLDPRDVALRVEAARARLDAGDAARALELLADALAARPGDRDLEHLQARALARTGQAAEARVMLVALADHQRSAGDIEGQARTLREALEAGEEDAALRRSVDEAEALVGQRRVRLWDVPVLAPIHDDEVVACTRAEILARYGFPERAVSSLEEALRARPSSVPIVARLVEILVDLDQTGDARGRLEAIARAARGQAREALAGRLEALGGSRIPATPPPAPEDDDLIEDIGADETRGYALDGPEGPLARADALHAAGDLVGALGRYQEAWREDPRNDEILLKIAEIRTILRTGALTGAPAAPEVEEAPAEEPTADVPEEAGGSVDDAWARASVGLHAEALHAAASIPGLPARLVEARALRGLGQEDRAREILGAALDGARFDPHYLDALWDLADLLLGAGRYQGALTLLEELQGLAPDWRSRDVQNRIRGLRILLDRAG